MLYLVNRSTEDCKAGKEGKHELLEVLLSHRDIIRDTAGQQTLDHLKAYYAQGPFYVVPFSDDGPELLVRRWTQPDASLHW